MPLQPAPFRSGHRPKSSPAPSDAPVVPEKLPESLLAGCGLMAALSAASVLQHLHPDAHLGGFPLAGLIGLLTGWTLAYPVVSALRRWIDPARVWEAVSAAIGAGMVLALPAAFLGRSIGPAFTAPSALLLGAVFGGAGLIWGGYLDFDRDSER